MKKNTSIEFEWNENEFDDYIKAAPNDDGIKLSLKYLKSKDIKILEAGCGNGRVVKYLYDLGFKNIYGIELNQTAVDFINNKYPELMIEQGNILNMRFSECSFDVVLSYGVIEHFKNGLEIPLIALKKVLKFGGIAVITVPSYNVLRRIKNNLIWINPRYNNFIRKILGKKKLSFVRNRKNKNEYLYHVYPPFGDFFEYHLRPNEFEILCKKTGFKIIETLPISHIDGMYHIFGKLFVKFENKTFKLNFLGKILNRIFVSFPFFHNHMHACVLERV